MKKLLFQLDTDPLPNTFDTVVAYDAGADHVTGLGGVTPANVARLVEGAVFTRAPAHKKYTALFVTGSNLAAGTAVLEVIRRQFFGKFRVSVMLDSNGANTTAAAAISTLAQGRDLRGKRAVMLAATGPVGQRLAAMLALEGTDVVITSREFARAEAVSHVLNATFGIAVRAGEARDPAGVDAALADAHIVISVGAAGVTLLSAAQWQAHPTLELVLDANASPPAGIEGVAMTDKATLKQGKLCFGGLGFGGLKLELQRQCIALLFERNDRVLDAIEILALAKPIAARRESL